MSPAPWARAVVLALWLLLGLALVAWHASRFTAPAAAVATLFTAGPLLLPLHGLWRGSIRTYRWAALTLTPALIWSLTELVADRTTRGSATLVAGLVPLLLAALVAALRSAAHPRCNA